MTPREALEPEPDPVPTAASESATDWLLDSIQPIGHGARTIHALLIERREQGRERYGTELVTHTGRNPSKDAIQEAVDLLLYEAQHAMETGLEPVTLGPILDVLLILIRRLGVDGGEVGGRG